VADWLTQACLLDAPCLSGDGWQAGLTASQPPGSIETFEFFLNFLKYCLVFTGVA